MAPKGIAPPTNKSNKGDFPLKDGFTEDSIHRDIKMRDMNNEKLGLEEGVDSTDGHLILEDIKNLHSKATVAKEERLEKDFKNELKDIYTRFERLMSAACSFYGCKEGGMGKNSHSLNGYGNN